MSVELCHTYLNEAEPELNVAGAVLVSNVGVVLLQIFCEIGEMVPAVTIAFSIIVMEEVVTVQPELSVIKTSTESPSDNVLISNVLEAVFCLVTVFTLKLYVAAAIGVAVYKIVSPVQKVLLILPVTVKDTTGSAATLTVIELVLPTHALGSGLPPTNGLL